MRIFISCQQALRKHDIPAYAFWETYIKKGIEEAGFEWLEAHMVDWAEGLTYDNRFSGAAWRERTWSKTVSWVKKEHAKKPISLFLGYLYPNQIDIAAIQEIQSIGIPCVNFFCDNVREFTHIPTEFTCFDLHWVPEFKAVPMYQKAGLGYVYAPMPLWVPTGQRSWQHPEKYGISFIGSRDIQREILFAQVLDAGIPLEIRGTGWDKSSQSVINNGNTQRNLWKTGTNQFDFIASNGFRPWLRKISSKMLPKRSEYSFSEYVKKKPNDLEYVEITQQSMITLGVNRYPSFRYPLNKPDTYSRLRDLEAPMLGACYLTEWTEGLDDLYELGTEIETYKTAEEMVDKIKYLQAEPDKRKKLRFSGQRRALSDHTVAKSLSKIFKSLGCR